MEARDSRLLVQCSHSSDQSFDIRLRRAVDEKDDPVARFGVDVDHRSFRPVPAAMAHDLRVVIVEDLPAKTAALIGPATQSLSALRRDRAAVGPPNALLFTT